MVGLKRLAQYVVRGVNIFEQKLPTKLFQELL